MTLKYARRAGLKPNFYSNAQSEDSMVISNRARPYNRRTISGYVTLSRLAEAQKRELGTTSDTYQDPTPPRAEPYQSRNLVAKMRAEREKAKRESLEERIKKSQAFFKAMKDMLEPSPELFEPSLLNYLLHPIVGISLRAGMIRGYKQKISKTAVNITRYA